MSRCDIMRLCSSAGFLPPTNTSNTLVKSTRLLPHLQMEQSTTGFTPKTEQEAVFTQASHIFLLYVFFSIVCFIIGNWLFKIISLTELVLWGSFGSKRTGLAPELKTQPGAECSPGKKRELPSLIQIQYNIGVFKRSSGAWSVSEQGNDRHP